ncbi:MAG: VOC family protein [Rhodospirillaceae bacterium]|nr:VOC family protein [Rhodospirillaceae bacterium]
MTIPRFPRLACVVLAVLAMGFGGEAAAQGSPGARAAGLKRLTLVVSDIDKSLDFYQRVGLVKSSEKNASEADSVYGAAELPLTADSTRSRVVVLNGDDQSLALVWYDRPALPSARGNLLGIGTGDVIIGIVVPDLEGAYSRLNQIGTRFPLPPGRFTAADGTAASGRHLYAYDPDGRMVEVMQLDARK